MPANIQGIEFEIKGSADKASASVERLTNALNELKGALGSGLKATKIKNDLEKINKAADKGLNSLKLKDDVDKTNHLLSRGLKTERLIESLEKANEALQGGLDTTGIKNSILEAGNLLKSTPLDKLETRINSALKSIRKQMSAEDYSAIKDNLEQALKQAEATVRYDLEELSNSAKKGISETNDALSGVSNDTGKKIELAGAKGKKSGDEAAKGKSGWQQLAETVSKSTNTFKRFLKIANTILAPFKKIGKAVWSVAKNIASFSGNLLTMPFRNAIKGAANFAKKLHSVAGAFKRIAFYRFIRTIIKEVTQAFTEGINSLYAWSSAIDGEFARSMDMIATSMNYFKNSIGAMVAPLINALAPALDFVIDKVVDFLNVINQLFAKLTGASYWTRAKKVATQYGEATEDAAGGVGSVGKAAKEALKYLAPFDELNVLPSDTESTSGRSGGGSGGADATAGEDAFEYVNEFSQGITTFTDQIKNAIEKSDWKTLGTTLGNKVNELVDKIPWATAGAKFGTGINAIVSTQYWTLKEINFTNIGNNIAKFINNALDKIDFEVWGRLLIRKVTAAIDFLVGLINGLDENKVSNAISGFFNGAIKEGSEWINDEDNKKKIENVGTKLGKILNNSLLNIDFSTAGTTLGNGLNTVINTIDNFITTPDWSGITTNVVTGINQAINTINWSNIGSTTADGMNVILDIWGTAVSTFEWSEFGSDLGTSLTSWAKTFNWTKLGEDIGKTINGIYHFLKAFIEETDWEEVKKGLTDAFVALVSEIEWGNILIDAIKLAFWNSAGGLSLQNALNIIDDNLTVKVYGEETDSFKDTKKSFDSLQDKDATATGKGEKDKSFSFFTTGGWLDKAKDKIVTAFGKGKQDSSFSFFSSNKGNWQSKASNKTVTAIGKAKQDSTFEFFTKSKNNWQNKAKDKTVTALGKGKEDKSFNTGLKHYNELTSKEVTATIKGNIVPTSNTLTIAEIKANNVLYRNQRTGVWTPLTQAQGGVFSGGKWRPIEQYASGGITNAGQLFIAREAGPELVGTLGGHTAVMNNNQIVASVSAGVARAIAGIRFSLRGLSDPMAKASAIMAYQTEAIEQSIEMATSRLAPYMQDDESMEEKMYSAMMRALSEQERDPIENKIYLDGRVVYQDVVQQNNQNIMRTGVNPLAQRA